mmetsp:Transcript_26658/g.66303  ORF Transcript_26658/g.66303 Transcript_26658/m.66303 type:complete len:86 (+) Transcript_26658:92-349(+)
MSIHPSFPTHTHHTFTTHHHPSIHSFQSTVCLAAYLTYFGCLSAWNFAPPRRPGTEGGRGKSDGHAPLPLLCVSVSVSAPSICII